MVLLIIVAFFYSSDIAPQVKVLKAPSYEACMRDKGGVADQVQAIDGVKSAFAFCVVEGQKT